MLTVSETFSMGQSEQRFTSKPKIANNNNLKHRIRTNK
jgi:hypothetical protein